jgi:hypothetical protein
LTGDLSESQRAIVAAHREKTRQAASTLSLLREKDNTIQSLAANVTYLSIHVGKLANKVDLQKKYISLLRQKLHLSQSKNRKLRQYIRRQHKANEDVKQRLDAIKSNLASADAKRNELKAYLTANKDSIQLPSLGPDYAFTGPRITGRRKRVKINSRLRPVVGSETFARSVYPFYAPNYAVHTLPANYGRYGHSVVSSPIIFPAGPTFSDGDAIQAPSSIPTIIMERPDDGN